MNETHCCSICGQARRHLMPARLVRSSIVNLIRADHPAWTDENYICLDDLNLYRSRFVENVLEQERGELSKLEADVIRSMKEQEIIAENLETMDSLK